MATATTTLPAEKFDTTTVFVRPDPAPTRVPLDKLAVLPGFNTRVKDDDYRERVSVIGESIAANGFFDDKPFAVTMLPNDDTVYIYDGEHRFDGAKQALLDGAEFPDGLPVAWAKDGATVKDLTIHLAHGNNGERLNMVELAAVVRRMQGLQMTKDEIATALGRTTRHVDNLFVLAAASNAVKKAVATNQIAGAEAVKLLRKDPKTAGAKIAEAVAAAVEKGKAKATPKSMKDTATGEPAKSKVKMKLVQLSINVPEGETMGAVLKAMATEIRANFKVGEGDKLLETGMIRYSIQTVDHEAEAAAKLAAEEKAKAAAQREIDRTAAAKVKADEAAAKQAKKEADAKAAADKALAAAAAKKKAPAPRKAAPKTPVKAPAGGKADGEAKAPRTRRTAREAAPTPPAVTSVAGQPSQAPSGQESAPASDLPPESMGGL